MRHFTVRQFAKACQAQYFGPEEVLEQEIHGVVIDNRQIEEIISLVLVFPTLPVMATTGSVSVFR